MTDQEPAGPGAIVLRHPLQEEIHEMVVSGFSPQSIHSLLSHQYRIAIELEEIPPLPSYRAIYRYRDEHVSDAEILPTRQLTKRLQGAQARIDLMQRLQDLFVDAENRYSLARDTEEGLKLPLPGTDKALESLLHIAEQIWKVGQDLGLYPRSHTPLVQVGVGVGVRPGRTVILQVGEGPPRVVDLMDPESVKALSLDELRVLHRLLEDEVIEAEVITEASGG